MADTSRTATRAPVTTVVANPVVTATTRTATALVVPLADHNGCDMGTGCSLIQGGTTGKARTIVLTTCTPSMATSSRATPSTPMVRTVATATARTPTTQAATTPPLSALCPCSDRSRRRSRTSVSSMALMGLGRDLRWINTVKVQRAGTDTSHPHKTTCRTGLHHHRSMSRKLHRSD